MNKALFLDRDGVLNVDKGYVHKWADIEWIPEVFEMIKMANERGYKVIVLTNQSGIDKGMYTHEDVHLLHKKMQAYLEEKKLRVDEWLYCAEMDSDFRKPRPGMLLAAQKKHDVNLALSFMVGDKASDVFDTDGTFVRPQTFLVKGNYDLKEAHGLLDVKIFDSHQEILNELKSRL